MKLISKFFGILFALLGTAAAAFAVWLCVNNINSIPVLLAPIDEAKHQAEILMDAVAEGDYNRAGNLILGTPKLGVDRDPEDPTGVMIWEAFVASYQYELVGDCYATDSGVAQNVRVTYLDIGSVTKNLRQRSQALLEARIAEAEDISELYNENNEFREEFVLEALYDAVRDALREDARQISLEFTLNLVYRDGTWVVVSDDILMTAISGGIVK
jgi:hypothetical protein